jgi:hypothetical protein
MQVMGGERSWGVRVDSAVKCPHLATEVQQSLAGQGGASSR